MKEIVGSTAVVTGAGGGIGRSIALALSRAGAAAVAVADIDGDAAEGVAKEIIALGGQASAHIVDVSELESVESLAEAVYDRYGSVEILANNAGVTMRPFRASWDTSYQDFQWMMRVNFWGVLHGHLVFVPRMRQTPGEKHIVNTSSMASLRPAPGHSAYSAAKSAVDGLSRCAREELRTQGIGVSLLHPGPVRTRIVTSERLRPNEERSDSRDVIPWSTYVSTPTRSIVAAMANPEDDVDVATTPDQYITPDLVGDMVIAGILEDKPYILTHPAPVEAILGVANDIIAGEPHLPSSDRLH